MKKKKQVYFIEGTLFPSKKQPIVRKKKKIAKSNSNEYVKYLENKLRKQLKPKKKKPGTIQERIGRIDSMLERNDGRFAKMKEVIEATQQLIEEQDRYFKKKAFDQEKVIKYVDRKMLEYEINHRTKRMKDVDNRDVNEEEIEGEDDKDMKRSRVRASILEKTLPQFQLQLDKLRTNTISKRDIAEMETNIGKLRNICRQFNSDINWLRNAVSKQKDRIQNDLRESLREEVERDMKEYVHRALSDFADSMNEKCDSIKEKVREEIVLLLRRNNFQPTKKKKKKRKKKLKRSDREMRLKELYAEVASLELEEIYDKERETD